MAIITVLGDALLDVHAVPRSAPRAGMDVPAAVRIGPGGQGSNLAVRLVRRRHEVRLVTAIGADAIGGLLTGWLAAEGVDVREMPADESGAVVVVGGRDGERTMLSQRVPLRGAAPDGALTGATWLVVSGYALLDDGANDLASTVHGGVRRAVVGCSLEPRQVGAWSTAAAALTPDLVVVNGDEAGVLSPNDGTAVGVRAAIGGIAVVTHPGRAEAATDRERVMVEHPRQSAVDTTGAGDAFAAVLVSELADDPWPPSAGRLETAMAVAAAAAAAVTQQPGAQVQAPGEARSGTPG